MNLLRLTRIFVLFFGLTSCSASSILVTDEYSFTSGENFFNTSFMPTQPEIQSIEDDYETQVEEDLTIYQNKIDISKYSKGNKIKINRGGEYLITGENFNISFEIDCFEEVTFILNNTKFISTFSNPINVTNASKFNLYIPSKTKNYISESLSTEQNAAIYANSEVNIYGIGYLYLNSFPDDFFFTTSKPVIYSSRNISINNTHIKISYADGLSIESLNNININNAHLEISYTSGGIFAKKDVSINDSILVINSYGDAINGDSLNINDASLYLTSNGNYDKVDYELSTLDYNVTYFIKNEADYIRIDLSTYNGIETLYKLDNSATSLNALNDINMANSFIFLDSDDYGIKANNIYSTNNQISIKSSNTGLFASNEIKIVGENNRESYLKIVSSYEGLLANNIELNGGSNYIISSNIGINGINEPNLATILIKNQERLYINSSVKGVNINSNLTIEDSLVTFFNGQDNETKAISLNSSFNLLNSTLISLDENTCFPKSEFENVYDIKLDNSFEKYSALHFYSDEFATSLILPKSYESLTLSIACDKLKEGNYVLSKDGYLNYEFNDNLALNNGYPYEDTHIKDFYLFNSKLSY